MRHCNTESVIFSVLGQSPEMLNEHAPSMSQDSVSKAALESVCFHSPWLYMSTAVQWSYRSREAVSGKHIEKNKAVFRRFLSKRGKICLQKWWGGRKQEVKKN